MTDITELFDYNRENNNHEEYDKYMSYYYQAPSKKDTFGREFKDGKIILHNLKDPKKRIIITPAKTANLYYYYKKILLENDVMMEKVSTLIEGKQNLTKEDYDEFEEIKKKYSLYLKQIQEIDGIHSNHYKEIDVFITDKIEKGLLMAKYYNERVKQFKEIKEPILKEAKNEMIKLFKENGNRIPIDASINKLSRKHNIPSNDSEEWFKWIEKCYLYMMARKKLYEVVDKLKENKEDFEIKLENCMIEKPVIEKN
jgi:hypothetical protein